MMKPFVLMPVPQEWINDIKLEPLEPLKSSAKIPAETKKTLQDLAAKVATKASDRSAMRILEEIARSKDTATQFVPTVTKYTQRRAISHTSYKNPTLRPYMLITSAIFENMCTRNSLIPPRSIFASDTLLTQLEKDLQYCMGERFDGSIPFTQPDGKQVRIMILSAKKTMDIALPKDTVWCAN